MFRNYLVAKEKFQPDIFLYENNKSAAKAIKEQIKEELGVNSGHAKYIEINSALLSAQNRKRFYVHNCGDVQQPEDRGILLEDVLENGHAWQDESFCILASEYKGCSVEHALQKHKRTKVAIPIRIGQFGKGGQAERIYSPKGKSRSLIANGGGGGAKTGLYAVSTTIYGDEVYEVRNGQIEIKGRIHPIKLDDGFYTIRKLSPVECERLQTLPDGYTEGVSNTQRYKALGNGWTAEVIMHILHNALKNIPKDEKIEVLSMYDGIATGRYCLDKMGFTNVKYYAYEIDKYAKQIAMKNYPDIIQMGDAFDVNNEDWILK